MQSIVLSLASRHALSPTEVISEIESAFVQFLSQWNPQKVMIFLWEGMCLEVEDYGRSDGLTGNFTNRKLAGAIFPLDTLPIDLFPLSSSHPPPSLTQKKKPGIHFQDTGPADLGKRSARHLH